MLTVLALVGLFLLLGVSASAVLCVAPALLLACALYLRRYPGERLLIALRRRGVRPRSRASSAAVQARVSPVTWIARGGLLMAFSLAVRPPPAALPTS